MTLSNAVKSSRLISWKSIGRFQQTLGRHVEVTGKGLHSGKESTVRISPEYAGKGRFFDINGNSDDKSYSIPASIDFVHMNSLLCTTLFNRRLKIRTVEHLLSALEATGVDNCRIQILNNSNSDTDCEFEVPILDGSATGWVEAIEEGRLVEAVDENGKRCERLAPFLKEPVYVQKNDSYVAAFPCDRVCITCGIDFSQVPAIGRQWFFIATLDECSYIKDIAASRTFCIYEEVERMREMGLIKGGSAENAIVCSESKGWLNPPLRFSEEPCRHKILDLVGDFSLFAQHGNQGLPVAHIIAYKAGHSLHADFVRRLSETFTIEEQNMHTAQS